MTSELQYHTILHYESFASRGAELERKPTHTMSLVIQVDDEDDNDDISDAKRT